jgi:HEAT repeat protein
MNAELEYPSDDSVRERWRTVSDMEKNGRAAVEGLTRELQSDDKWIRIAAADALGNIGDQKALDPLAQLLFDKDHDVRFATVVALGKLGGPMAEKSLVGACKDANCYVRMAAEEALSHMKNGLIS